MKYVRKRKIIKYLSFVLAIAFVIGTGFIIKKTFFYTKDDLINISKLSDDFMDVYFKDISKGY